MYLIAPVQLWTLWPHVGMCRALRPALLGTDRRPATVFAPGTVMHASSTLTAHAAVSLSLDLAVLQGTQSEATIHPGFL